MKRGSFVVSSWFTHPSVPSRRGRGGKGAKRESIIAETVPCSGRLATVPVSIGLPPSHVPVVLPSWLTCSCKATGYPAHGCKPGREPPHDRSARRCSAGRPPGLPGRSREHVFHPQEQGRPEIEADPGIVADDRHDAAFAVQIPGGGIGVIALGGDPFIPVMIGIGGILDLDGFQPGIFAGGW